MVIILRRILLKRIRRRNLFCLSMIYALIMNLPIAENQQKTGPNSPAVTLRSLFNRP